MVLFDAAAHPVETHAKIFAVILAYVASEGDVGGRAVNIDWGGRLRVAYFDEGRADGNSLLAVEENRSSFRLRGGSHDSADHLIFGEYWSIQGVSGSDAGRSCIVA